MTYVLAIDVGTSFTAAAVVRFSQEAFPAPESLPLGLRGAAVPSVLYYPEEGPPLVGEAAERRGLDFPGRVVREFKRRVGDAVPISVGDLSLPAEDVFATMARWVVDRATEREGAAPSEVILTHPAAWGSHRISLILAAMAAKNLDNVSLVPEPEAAALYYASQVRVEAGSTIAVYDLGGGTFDTAVLRKTGRNRFELVGRPEGIDHLGGADFDAAVFRYVTEHTGDVLSALDLADAGVRGALGRLRRECVEAKEALSLDSEASISVLLPGFQQQIRLVRADFEALIEDCVRDTVEGLEESLAQLELEPADLSAVLLIGGSSRIPLVAQLVSETLDRPIAVDADPKSSICFGAAVSAVLARAEAQSAAAETPAEAAGTTVAPAPEGNGHVAHLASWSRKSTTAGGALSAAGPSAHGHGGTHAPKPTVRLTAIAAAAAVLVTVLTATAAQSPAGFSDLTAIFVPETGAAATEGPAAGGSSGGGGAGAPAAAAPGAPVAGIQAGVNKVAVSGPGLDVSASPTSSPSSSAPAAVWGGEGAGSDAAAGPSAGIGTTSPAGTPATSVDRAAGQREPVGPGTGQPVPAPDPTTPAPDPTPETPPPPLPTTGSAPAPTTDAPPAPTTNAPPTPTTEAPPTPTETTAAPPPATEPAVSDSAAPLAAEPAA